MKIYNGVLYLKTNCSGLTWDDDLGMNIGPETESVWQGIILLVSVLYHLVETVIFLGGIGDACVLVHWSTSSASSSS